MSGDRNSTALKYIAVKVDKMDIYMCVCVCVCVPVFIPWIMPKLCCGGVPTSDSGYSIPILWVPDAHSLSPTARYACK